MRSELNNAKRIVVKLGTAVLTNERKHPDAAQMGQLIAQIARLRKAGKEIVIVTSGAVGAGMGVLGFDKRPESVAEQQACAAVGQSRLMATYEKLFDEYDLHAAQVLLTHADLQDEERHRNARNTLTTLLRRGVIPIINENDAVSTTELKFGDNDKLSALVAALLPAKGMRSALVLPMVMMRPPSAMCRAASCAATKTARTFTPTERSKSSSDNWSSGAIFAMPALFTNTSIRPRVFTVSVTARFTALASLLSAWQKAQVLHVLQHWRGWLRLEARESASSSPRNLSFRAKLVSIAA